jgi:carbamoyl-phosphate synthase large subunit
MVTGAGSGVGQGIIKALHLTDLPVTTISSDISPLNPGLFRTDEYLLLPKVEEEGSLPKIISAIRDKEIDIVMIGSEFDLEFFSCHKLQIENETGTLIVVSPFETVKISNDKWLTVEFLKAHNLPYPESFLPENIDGAFQKAREWGYPFILKSRFGTASRHVYFIYDDHDLSFLYNKVPMPMLQKIIEKPKGELGNEYTCSIFKCRNGDIVGPFTSRRTLRGGSSWVVEVDAFEQLHHLLNSIGEIMPTMGSLNIQLMVGPDGPVPFEFNARFSGTTAIRAYFGFNEPEMVLLNYYLKKNLPEIIIRKGLVLRYLEEVFIEGKLAADLDGNTLPKGEIVKWF